MMRYHINIFYSKPDGGFIADESATACVLKSWESQDGDGGPASRGSNSPLGSAAG